MTPRSERMMIDEADSRVEGQRPAWPEKAVGHTNLIRAKSAVAAVSTFKPCLSGISDSEQNVHDEDKNHNKDNDSNGNEDFSSESEAQEVSKKSAEISGWNPLSRIRISRYAWDCKEIRRFLHRKRLRYVEINIDVYPSRKLELEEIAGSHAVPRVFFNEVLVDGLAELKSLEESGKLGQKIEHVVAEAPSFEAPLPPLSGEADLSSSRAIDELALIF
ncbi:uncharacterized protein LOC111397406 [Olea europaea subsp. europaea]|uniref:Uncharacterized protein LOC111397406 n=1 Tax=Olea europaea subsp. europaea TaxID=158383 RepID=A0A8S0SSC4_OLEEU|nr:uncharacterized protein LOC111397406 [Olea europaea subsp. europaea]